MQPLVTTARLTLRDWSPDDAPAALAIYGSSEVAHWLTPVLGQIADVDAMRSVLEQWQQEQPGLTPPQGRWAIQRNDDGAVVGGVGIRLLPPNAEDLELSWQLNPDEWGKGYATEAARGADHVGVHPGHRRTLRGRPAEQRPCARDGQEARHAVGRRDHEVLRPEPAGVPTSPRRPPGLTDAV